MTAETLRSAMRCSACEEFSFVPKEENIDWNFSKAFLMRMDSLIGREYHSFRRSTATVKRILLIAVLAATLLLSLLSVSAFREPAIRFFAEMFGDHMDLSFGVEKPGDTQTPEETFAPYLPTYMPNGFERIEYSNDGGTLYVEWKNEEGETISLMQLPSSASISIDTEQTVTKTENINGKNMVIQTTSTGYNIFWTFDKYSFILTSSSSISYDEAILIASSLAEA